MKYEYKNVSGYLSVVQSKIDQDARFGWRLVAATESNGDFTVFMERETYAKDRFQHVDGLIPPPTEEGTKE